VKRGFFCVVLAATLCASVRLPTMTYADTSAPALNFQAVPANPSTVDPHVRNYFWERTRPGQSISEAIVIQNPNSRPIRLEIEPVQALTGTNGGIVYSSGVAHDTWLHGLPSRISVPAHSSQRVTFQIRVPTNADSGTHLFGVALENKTQDTTNRTDRSGVSLQIHEQIRRVLAVQCDIPGRQHIDFDFQNAKIAPYPSGPYLSVTGLTESNVILSGIHGTVTLKKNGHTVQKYTLQDVKFAPHSALSLQEPMQYQEPGNYQVVVDLYGSQIGHYHKVLPFTISANSISQYQELSNEHRVTVFVTPSWLWVALGLLVLLVLLLLLRLHRFSKRERVGAR
jgi:hypothetical protein